MPSRSPVQAGFGTIPSSSGSATTGGVASVGFGAGGNFRAGQQPIGSRNCDEHEQPDVKIVLTEVGPAEVDPAEFGLEKVGLAKVGTAEIGPTEVGIPEVRIAEIGLAKIGPAQVGLTEIGIAEVDFAGGFISTPGIPSLSTLPEDGKLFRVGHTLSPPAALWRNSSTMPPGRLWWHSQPPFSIHPSKRGAYLLWPPPHHPSPNHSSGVVRVVSAARGRAFGGADARTVGAWGCGIRARAGHAAPAVRAAAWRRGRTAAMRLSL